MKSYCAKCKAEVDENIKECTCGCKMFIYGENIEFKDGILTCKCGSDSFVFNAHIDYKEKSDNKYSCKKCGETFGIETYRREEDMWMWED